MKRAALLAFALAACGGDDGENAQTLWLASNGSELRVHLVEHEPEPY